MEAMGPMAPMGPMGPWAWAQGVLFFFHSGYVLCIGNGSYEGHRSDFHMYRHTTLAIEFSTTISRARGHMQHEGTLHVYDFFNLVNISNRWLYLLRADVSYRRIVFRSIAIY